MKLSAALDGVQALYIETAPMIYYVEENASYIAIMDAVIAAVEHSPITVVGSVMVLLEALVQPIRAGNILL